METNPKQAARPVISRLGDLMAHSSLYAFKGNTRMANEIGSNPNTISRLVCGRLQNPSFFLVARITAALEREFGRHIDPREVFAEAGEFISGHVCMALGCIGCYRCRKLQPNLIRVAPRGDQE